jgi:uncharacterized membrane protein
MYTHTSKQPAAGIAAPAAGPTAFASAALIAATVLTGLATGVMALYAHTIMPGLKKTDDRTFVGAFTAIDRAIINPWFMFTFFGALILIGLVAVLHFSPGRRSMLPWLIAAFGLYLLTVIITMGINVPLNNAIDAAGDPNHIDVAKVRAAFHESTWASWNYVRTITATAAFVILAGVLAARKRT